jgi:cell division protein FtsI (penicillin-binding protein 3)
VSDLHDPPSPSSPAPRFGAPLNDVVPRMEHVRVTAPDLARRAALERTRARLALAAAGFFILFAAVALKLADATIIQPVAPKLATQMLHPDALVANDPAHPLALVASNDDFAPHARRAMIEDRNGEILAVSLTTAALFANPREMTDAADAAHKLKAVLPELDEAETRARLADTAKQFVYLARQLTPRQQGDVNRLGIPGIYFQETERRRYPLGRVAAHVIGGVDVDGHGIAGVERFFDQRLHDDAEPLRLSIDVRVQAVVRDELSQAMTEFQAIGACGIVMDVRTGEVLALVSLPDYDANDVGHATDEERFNRAVTGMYEPGSTFKLQTAAMALDSGAAQLWNMYDASQPIHIGRFTITDFEGKHRWLYLPEVIAYSSNLGAAHIAMSVGAERQREWHKRMGMFSRIGIELPEAGLPIVPSVAAWKEVTTMTIGFGHGIAVSPLHVVRGTATLANGGILLRPTILARPPDLSPPQGERVMQLSTSDTIRKLMRLVVTDGYGKKADIPGYFVGGKTGTAEKTSGHAYRKHANVSAFMSAFPMNAPRYAVYMMLDEPHGNAETGGFSTAGQVSAPMAGRVIARIGPMLGLLPETDNAAAIQASLAMPLQPGRSGAAKTAGATPAPAGHAASPAPPGRPAAPLAPIAPVLPRDLRHEAILETPALAAR